jgi:hypothetical protein
LSGGAVVVFILSMSTSGSASAYLDPGTGWMIVQGLIAAVAAVGVGVRTYWSRLKGWFGRATGKAQRETAPLAKDGE